MTTKMTALDKVLERSERCSYAYDDATRRTDEQYRAPNGHKLCYYSVTTTYDSGRSGVYCTTCNHLPWLVVQVWDSNDMVETVYADIISAHDI